jgi:hypothetical protein
MLPAGAVASVASAAPAAEVAAGIMAAAAVARQFKTSTVIDPRTFQPRIAVAITTDDKSRYLGTSDHLDEIKIKIDGKSPLEFIDNSTPELRQESKNILDVVIIRDQLERQGLPPLTDEETSIIIARKVETV